MFLDDLLEQGVVELESRGLGYLRNREPQENFHFEFLVESSMFEISDPGVRSSVTRPVHL